MSESITYKFCGCRDDDLAACSLCEGWSQEELDKQEVIRKQRAADERYPYRDDIDTLD